MAAYGSKLGNVVVTGGAGFIGSHLVDALVASGHRVIVIDNLSTGKFVNIQHHLKVNSEKQGSRSSASPIDHKCQVVFIKGSIIDLPLLKELFRGVDYVFHEAALASVPAGIADPLADHETNNTATLYILLAARDNGVKKVIFASSAAVYGDPKPSGIKPIDETFPPYPLSPYAVSKLTAEHYCRIFTELYGLPTVCLRYFNVYGPRQNPCSEYAAVIPRFIDRVLAKQPPVIFGDGEQMRDFVYIKDVVEANLMAAMGDATGIFNIGSGNSITINKLAETIINLNGNKLVPGYKEARPGDIRYSLADISGARTFGYKPKYTLEQGLREMIHGMAIPV